MVEVRELLWSSYEQETEAHGLQRDKPAQREKGAVNKALGVDTIYHKRIRGTLKDFFRSTDHQHRQGRRAYYEQT